MSQSASGTIKSFSFAKSCQAVRTKAMASKLRGWQVCQRKFSTGPRKFLRIWSVRQAWSKHRPSENYAIGGNPPQLLINRNWICYEVDGSSPYACRSHGRRTTRIGTRTLQAVIPSAEAYLVAELHIVINYPRWRLRRKRN